MLIMDKENKEAALSIDAFEEMFTLCNSKFVKLTVSDLELEREKEFDGAYADDDNE